jgi:flagellin-like hook-associated protein FlgL
MRISDTRAFREFLYNYNRIKDELNRSNQEISTGKKLINPSDDPVNVSRAIRAKADINKIEQYNKNINYDIAYSKEVDLALSEVQDIIVNIKQKTISAMNGTMGEDDRATLSDYILENLDDLKSIANRKFMGKPLFSGLEINKLAYSSIDSAVENIDALPSIVSDLLTSNPFKDLPELDKGVYNVNIVSDGTNATVSLSDEDGNVIQIDNNGVDNSSEEEGNQLSDSMVISNAAGKTVSLGRGFEIQFAPTLSSGTYSFNVEFTEDNSHVYNGDAGVSKSRITDDIVLPLSVPGLEIFQANKILGTTFIDNTNGFKVPVGGGDVVFTIGDGSNISTSITLTEGTTYNRSQILDLFDNAGLYIGTGDSVTNSVNLKVSFDDNGHLLIQPKDESTADKITIREYTNNKNNLQNTIGLKTGTFKGEDIFDVINDIAEMVKNDTFNSKIGQATTWTGNSQSEVSVNGSYSGTSDNTFLFTVDATGGTVGVTTGLKVTVTDKSSGNIVAVLDVGDTYQAGTDLEVADGIKVSFNAYSLEANDSFMVSARTERDRLDRLESSLNQVLSQSVKAGFNIDRLESSSTRLKKLTLTMTEELSNIEDADIAQSYVNYQSDETVYNAMMNLFARFQKLTLLDFI